MRTLKGPEGHRGRQGHRGLGARGLRVLAVLGVLVVLPGLVEASPLEHRNQRQQAFILEYLKAHSPAPFASTEEIDAFLRPLQAAWAKEAGADPVLARLNPYAVMWTLGVVFEQREPYRFRCHVWAEYAVPAFLADLDFVRREPEPAKAFLLRRSELAWAADPAFRCDLPAERWAALKAALLDYPAIAEGYLARGGLPKPELEADLRRVAGEARSLEPLLEILDGIYQGRLEPASAQLAAAFGRKRHVYHLVALGERLGRGFHAAGNPAAALDVLDLMARSTTAQDLPRDLLESWYAKADPERGPARFAKAAAQTPPPLVPSGVRVELKGVYRDLRTGEPVDLSRYAGKTVLLDFWSVACVPCLREIPALNDFAARHAEELVLIGVSNDYLIDVGEADVRKVVRERGIEYPALYDLPERSLSRQLGVEGSGWPSRLLIDARGELLVRPTAGGDRRVGLAEVEAWLKAGG